MSSLTPKRTDFNIFTGELTYEPSPNFSYEYIPTGCCAIVHEYQQMFVYSTLTIYGTIKNNGTIILR